jgi:hypothetical protein
VVPVDAGTEVLGQIGAVDGKGQITPLGGWMRARATRKAITKQYVTAHAGKATPDNTCLSHSYCQRRATGARKDPAPL